MVESKSAGHSHSEQPQPASTPPLNIPLKCALQPYQAAHTRSLEATAAPAGHLPAHCLAALACDTCARVDQHDSCALLCSSSSCSGRRGRRCSGRHGRGSHICARAALDALHQPVKAVKEALALRGARLLDVPLAFLEGGESHGVRNARRIQGAALVLFVCHHQQNGVLEVLLLQHRMQLGLGGRKALLVRAVHHEDDRVSVGVVAPPVWPD